MKIKVTKSGISFGSLVKLVSVGFFIGMAILMPLMFAALSFSELHRPMPNFLLLIIPILLAIQSLFTGLTVAVGVKLYGRVSKFEISSFEEKL